MCQYDYKIDFNPSSIKLYQLSALTVNSVGNITFNTDVHSNLCVPDSSQLVILCHPLWSHFFCFLLLFVWPVVIFLRGTYYFY